MKIIIVQILIFCSLACFSQKQDSVKSDAWKNIYRASATKINDLVHTKLQVSFDYSKSWMAGKAWITMHPHFYATDSLNLDAKNMDIKDVSLVKGGKHIPLKYVYNKRNLRIILDKSYKGGENYTIYIDYIAKPDDIKEKGSVAITGAKGLYFINPLGTEKNKPTQIWTQGETESNSGWFPTIDKPNQKTTNEIVMTVPAKYQTLSNGLLISQKVNNDGTRTDTWKMDLPHAPYLMMMAVGEFAIIKDHYKGKEVSYYVEKEFAPVARKIFGQTPEMISYFSQITGIDYPWPKYAQIVCRDYVSGAMENTTATVHGEFAQQDARQLVDENFWEEIIAHELFHQWFGDYVTTESWSNITLNESMADISETLWMEHKHGKDDGDAHNYNAMSAYLQSERADKNLVRFYYENSDDVFDVVSYAKGGRILNMLRNYVGDPAFYKSLNLYLKTKKFQSAEAHDLRLAFEEVTGQDLNWFWNQWYYGSGHPILDINYDYDLLARTAKVIIHQTQPGKIFKFKIAVDVYVDQEKKRYNVWVDQLTDTLSFPATSKPSLINVDGDKILLCKKTDHKSLDNFIYQYNNAGLYVDRREAIDYAASMQVKDSKALELLKTAMNDPYYGLRIFALNKINIANDSVKNSVESLIVNMAKDDPKSLVKAEAIKVLGKYKKENYKPLFLTSINDSSYAIAGSALIALGKIDSIAALEKSKLMEAQHVKGKLHDAIDNLSFMYANENEFDSIAGRFGNLPYGYGKIMKLRPFISFLKRIKNTANFKKGMDMIVSFREQVSSHNDGQNINYLNDVILNDLDSVKRSLGLIEQADYIRSKLPSKVKSKTPNESPTGSLQKYSGEYNNNLEVFKVILKEDNSLDLIAANGSVMKLIELSKDKFSVKDMQGYSVEFTGDNKNKVNKLFLKFSGGQIKELNKK